ncbi:MAG: cupin domain-containing protein, partial [Hominilimicola sp.]
MEVLQSNTADNIYFWIEDKEQGNVNPIYESHGAYEIYIVCNGERRMYLGNVLYKVGTGDALMISASTPHRSFGDGAFSGICIEFSDAYIKEHFTKSQYDKITECFKTPLISLPPNLLPIIRTYSLTAYNNVDMRNDCMLAIV